MLARAVGYLQFEFWSSANLCEDYYTFHRLEYYRRLRDGNILFDLFDVFRLKQVCLFLLSRCHHRECSTLEAIESQKRPTSDVRSDRQTPKKQKIDRLRRKPVSPIEKALQICQSSEMVHEDDFEIKFFNRYKGKAPSPAPPTTIVPTSTPHRDEPSTFPPFEPVQEMPQLDLLPLRGEKHFIPLSKKILESNVAYRMAQPWEEEMHPGEERAQPRFAVSFFEEFLVQGVQNPKGKGKFSSDIETLQHDLKIDRLSPNQMLQPQIEQVVENTQFTGIITGVGDIQAARDRGYVTGSEDKSGSEMSTVFTILDIEGLKTNTLLMSF